MTWLSFRALYPAVISSEARNLGSQTKIFYSIPLTSSESGFSEMTTADMSWRSHCLLKYSCNSRWGTHYDPNLESQCSRSRLFVTSFKNLCRIGPNSYVCYVGKDWGGRIHPSSLARDSIDSTKSSMTDFTSMGISYRSLRSVN